MAPIFEPSLPRLLSIEKDDADFDEQLNQAAKLAGLPAEWGEGEADDDQTAILNRSQHRAEWVLRWVLEKLQDRGNSANLSSRAWVLLRRIIPLMPISNAARLLNSHGVLSIIEVTLESIKNITVQVGERGPQPQASDSKKRKRTMSPTPETADQTSICGEIQNLLLLIAFLAKSSGDHAESVAREHMKAVLRTNTAQAARLLGLWFSYLGSRFDPALHCDESPKALGLQPMLTVWELRSLDPDDENGWSSSAFISEVLLPGIMFTADRAPIITSRDRDTNESTRSFERLLAKHVFIPARSSFLDAHRSRSTTNSFATAKVMSFFQPLKDELDRGLPLPHDYRTRLGPTFDRLLELAIDILPPPSIKKQREEEAWIEAVFEVLVDCAGTPIPEEPPSSVPPTDIVTIPHFIDVVKRRKHTLGSGVLQRILATYSGLVAFQEMEGESESMFSKSVRENKEDPAIRWSLIATILQVDGNVFTRTTGVMNQGNEATTVFAHLLLQTISQRRFYQIQDIPSFVVSIIAPLMQAYASGRDLSGFITSWYEGLSACADNLKDTAWSNDNMTPVLSALLEDSMTPNQITGILGTHVRVLEGAHLISSPAIIIVDAILQSIAKEETIDRSIPVLRSLLDLLMSDLHTKGSIERWHWRTWRILARIYELLFEAETPAEVLRLKQDLTSSGLLESICEFIKQTALEDATPSPLYAFNFITIATSNMLDLPELHNAAKQTMLDALESLSLDFIQNTVAEYSEYSVRGRTMNHSVLLGQARIHDFMIVLLQSSQVLLIIDSVTRRTLFTSLILLANERHGRDWDDHILLDADHRKGLGTNHDSYVNIVEALHENVLTLGCPHLRDDYIQVISRVLKQNSGANRVALRLLLRFPSSAMQRKDREAMLDTIVDLYRSDPSNKYLPLLTLSYLSTAIRLLEAPCLTSRLCTDSNAVAELIERFDGHEEDRVHERDISDVWVDDQEHSNIYMTYLEHLLAKVFKQVASDANVTRRRRYFDNLANGPLSEYVQATVRAVEECTKDLDPQDTYGGEWWLGASKAALSAFFGTLENWADMGEEIQKLANPICTALLESLPIILAVQKFRPGIFEMLQFRTVFEILRIVAPLRPELVDNPEVREGWNRHGFAESAITNCQDGYGGWEKIHTVPFEVIECLMHDLEFTRGLGYSRALLTGECGPRRTAKALAYCKKLALAESDPVEIAIALKDFWKPRTGVPDVSTLEVQHTLVKALKPLRQLSDDSERNIQRELSGVLPKLCKVLRDAPSVAHLCASIASIQTIIREKGWLVSQYGIDTLLASLTAALSCSLLVKASEHAGLIYLKLCHTTTAVISLRRKNLGGRFHLLLPLLQGLLACLFVPHNSSASSVPRPPWLPPRPSILTNEHAAAYTRILTTLCSPTVSSASTHRRSATADLIDETKKARQYAGQFVPQLLAYYCGLQLNGRLGAEVREALRPGLWSVMEVVEIENLRAMSEGMGKDERAVWGSLYGEWMRLGRA